MSVSLVLDWLRANETVMWWVGAGSVITFVGTLIAIPILVARIPADYFAQAERKSSWWAQTHPALRGLALVLKNGIGAVFLAAGIAMLVLPGQGILTILIGVSLMDFPGKFALERWLVCRGAVLRAINWIRERAGRVPLQAPSCVLPREEHPKTEPSS